MDVKFDRWIKNACLCLSTVIAVLVVLHVLTDALFANEELPAAFGRNYFYKMFDMNREHNIPTWYASFLWCLVSLGAFAAFFLEKNLEPILKRKWLWLVIAATFLAASCDEIATIHEHVGSYLQDQAVPSLRTAIASTLIRSGFDASTFVNRFALSRSPWIMFYAPILLIVGANCWIFLWNRLARFGNLRSWLLLTAFCYVSAISFDYIQGSRNLPVDVIKEPLGMSWIDFLDYTVLIEETMEDVGTMLLALAIARYALGLAGERLKVVAAPEEVQALDQPAEGSLNEVLEDGKGAGSGTCDGADGTQHALSTQV